MDIENIVLLYRENLIYFINRYIDNLDIAEDLAEDCFVELIVHPNRYKGEASVKTYLFTIGRNKAVDYVRKHLKRENLKENFDEYDDYTETIEGPLENLVKKEELEKLREGMLKIKEQYREALTLVYLEGLSYDEAAKILKKNKKQTENLVFRGKEALREILKGE